MLHHPLVCKKKAKAYSFALFLLGLAIVSYLQAWWPGIMLAIGIPLAIRQCLLGRYYDMLLSLIIFVGTFITAQLEISWEVILPVIFTLGAIYIFVREYLESDAAPLDEEEEDLNEEIEEEQSEHHPK